VFSYFSTSKYDLKKEANEVLLKLSEEKDIIIVDINYDGYLDVIKGISTPQTKDQSKNFTNHIVFVYDEKNQEYSFRDDISYFSWISYQNLDNYYPFDDMFSACGRSNRNPHRSRGCFKYYIK